MKLSKLGIGVIGLWVLAIALLGMGAYLQQWKKSRPAQEERNKQMPEENLAAKRETKKLEHPITNKGVTPSFKERFAALSDTPNLQSVLQNYSLTLTKAQEAFLNDHKFVLLETRGTAFEKSFSFDNMLSFFDRIQGSSYAVQREAHNARFVTPDIILHAYHKFFEMTLEELEQTDLSIRLERFLSSLHTNLEKNAKKSNASLRERYERLLAQITVARVLLENKGEQNQALFESQEQEEEFAKKDASLDTLARATAIAKKYEGTLSSDMRKKVVDELALIYTASDTTLSPLFSIYKNNVPTDYTQLTPRSHYTKNSRLRAYFRAMMYLGRSSYFVSKDIGIEDINALVDAFTQNSPAGNAPLDEWKTIMALTGFYAGASDDITYSEWNAFRTSVGTKESSTLRSNLTKLRGPQILSDILVGDDIPSKDKNQLLQESLAFRIFGQRFTYDAWILNSLTCGDERCVPKRPSMPSAVFIPATLGDPRARAHTETFLVHGKAYTPTEVKAFGELLETIGKKLKAVVHDAWFSSLGSAWLYVLSSLTHDFGEGYPQYMQSQAFQDKQIQTFLGSYTELKHDTLLYAKQSYAEKGGGGLEDKKLPPIVKGFVEPNLEFWQRISELIKRTEELFARHKVFESHTARARLSEFKDIVEFYQTIATKELASRPISDEEYEKLRTTNLSFMAEPFHPKDPDENSGKGALVADIHTDGATQQILYEATGEPLIMLALVANEQSPRVVIGAVFNHYEFTQPIGQRLTDEKWKEQIYAETPTLPKRNLWHTLLNLK